MARQNFLWLLFVTFVTFITFHEMSLEHIKCDYLSNTYLGRRIGRYYIIIYFLDCFWSNYHFNRCWLLNDKILENSVKQKIHKKIRYILWSQDSFVSKNPNEIKSLLVWLMAWCQTDTKPLAEPMMIQLTDANILHLTTMRLQKNIPNGQKIEFQGWYNHSHNPLASSPSYRTQWYHYWGPELITYSYLCYPGDFMFLICLMHHCFCRGLIFVTGSVPILSTAE